MGFSMVEDNFEMVEQDVPEREEWSDVAAVRPGIINPFDQDEMPFQLMDVEGNKEGEDTGSPARQDDPGEQVDYIPGRCCTLRWEAVVFCRDQLIQTVYHCLLQCGWGNTNQTTKKG